MGKWCRGCDVPDDKGYHCTGKGCHLTFTSVSAFDHHRKNFHCYVPKFHGLVLHDNGRWGWPPSKKNAERLEALKTSQST